MPDTTSYNGSDTRYLNMGYNNAFNEAAEAAAKEAAFSLFQGTRTEGSQMKMKVSNARFTVRVVISGTSVDGEEKSIAFGITVKPPAKVANVEANGLVKEVRRQAEAMRQQFAAKGMTGSHEVLLSVTLKI